MERSRKQTSSPISVDAWSSRIQDNKALKTGKVDTSDVSTATGHKTTKIKGISALKGVEQIQQVTSEILERAPKNVGKAKKAHTILAGNLEARAKKREKRKFTAIGKFVKRHPVAAAVATVGTGGIFGAIGLKGVIEARRAVSERAAAESAQAYVHILDQMEAPPSDDKTVLDEQPVQTNESPAPAGQTSGLSATERTQRAEQERQALIVGIREKLPRRAELESYEQRELMDDINYASKDQALPEDLKHEVEAWKEEIATQLESIAGLGREARTELLLLATNTSFDPIVHHKANIASHDAPIVDRVRNRAGLEHREQMALLSSVAESNSLHCPMGDRKGLRQVLNDWKAEVDVARASNPSDPRLGALAVKLDEIERSFTESMANIVSERNEHGYPIDLQMTLMNDDIDVPKLLDALANRGDLSTRKKKELLIGISQAQTQLAAFAKLHPDGMGADSELNAAPLIDAPLEEWQKEIASKLENFEAFEVSEQQEVRELAQLPLMQHWTNVEVQLLKLEIRELSSTDTAEQLEARSGAEQSSAETVAPNLVDDLDPHTLREIASREKRLHALGVKTPMRIPRAGNMSEISFVQTHESYSVNSRQIPDADASVDLKVLGSYLERIKDKIPAQINDEGMARGRDEAIEEFHDTFFAALCEEGKAGHTPRGALKAPVNALRHYVAHVKEQEAAIEAESDPSKQARMQRDLDDEMKQVFCDHLLLAAYHCNDRKVLECEKIYFERIAIEPSEESTTDALLKQIAVLRADVLEGVLQEVAMKHQDEISLGDVATFVRTGRDMLGPDLGVPQATTDTSQYEEYRNEVDRYKREILEQFNENYSVSKVADFMTKNVKYTPFSAWAEDRFETDSLFDFEDYDESPILSLLNEDGTFVNESGALLMLREMELVPVTV